MSEMIQPAARFDEYGIEDTVVFFGSARTLPRKRAATNLKRIEDKLKRTKSPTKELKKKYDDARHAFKMSHYYEDAVILAERLTTYFKDLKRRGRNLMICSGGGPGIMEAANRGAKKAKGRSIGLNISLPMEQYPNLYQTKELAMEFHYFFIRKFWFFNLAKALVVFPGGFGTMDELFELLTLMQTGKSKKSIAVILYGKKYWEEVIDFKNMIKWGTIDGVDMKLFKTCDTVKEAFEYLKEELVR
jgi:uncharacterized protein (TIGR00730 family)